MMSTLSPRSERSGGSDQGARHAADSAAEATPRWRLPKGALAIAALALVGVIVFLYPATAAWFSQYDQSKVVVDLEANVGAAVPEARDEALTEAYTYNEQLVSGATVSALSRKPVADANLSDDARYESLLMADTHGAMGRLRIDKISVDLPIYHGTSDATLAKGVGHLQGTSLPVGGTSTHSVLTAHRGLAGATLFDRLDELDVGDTFRLEVFGEVLVYRIIESQVVAPEDTESLFPRFGEDLVTLVTCTPLGINSHRILVTGERITPTPIADVQQAGTAPNIPGVPWWAVGLGGTVLVLGAYVWRMGCSQGRGAAHSSAR